MTLDAIDEQIVAFLLRDARASYAEIGAEVGLSAPAVKRRVDRLRRTGVVTGFTALVDATALGWTTEAYVELYCRGQIAARDIRGAVEDCPEVVAAYSVTGDADALLHVLAADIGHLDHVVQRIRSRPNVVQTKSVIVLERLLDRPLREPDTRAGRPDSQGAPIGESP